MRDQRRPGRHQHAEGPPRAERRDRPRLQAPWRRRTAPARRPAPSAAPDRSARLRRPWPRSRADRPTASPDRRRRRAPPRRARSAPPHCAPTSAASPAATASTASTVAAAMLSARGTSSPAEPRRRRRRRSRPSPRTPAASTAPARPRRAAPRLATRPRTARLKVHLARNAWRRRRPRTVARVGGGQPAAQHRVGDVGGDLGAGQRQADAVAGHRIDEAGGVAGEQQSRGARHRHVHGHRAEHRRRGGQFGAA